MDGAGCGVTAAGVGMVVGGVAIVGAGVGVVRSASTSEVCKVTFRSQVSSITRRAADSASVAVSPQSLLITIQSMAYWHQYA